MVENTPLVTVVTPVYNAAADIEGCLDSVAAQDWPSLEHIVVDGGSTDGTADILARRGVRFVSERDSGIYDAMSKGVRLARGEFVHILNADDRFTDVGSVRALAQTLVAGGHDLAHGFARHVDTHGNVVRTFGEQMSFRRLLAKMRVAHPTVMVRRAVYERFGTFSVGFRIAADHEFLLRIWRKVEIAFVPRVLVDMRIGGVSTDNANVARAYHESMAAALMHGANPVLSATRCYYEILKHLVFFRTVFK